MEGEEIGMVMARASELKTKFSDCIIHRYGGPNNRRRAKLEEDSFNVVVVVVGKRGEDEAEKEGEEEEKDAFQEEEEEVEEEETLVNIRDAFEALEQQLSALQALQQQQRYERESSLFQIDRSRKILLSKLKEYKGDDLEVIHEALTFAGGTLGHDDDLLLPPYPSHLPDLFVTDDPYPPSRFTSMYKFTRNGGNGEVMQEARKSMDGSEEKQRSQPTNRNKSQGIRLVFGLLAKSVLTFVGVVSVLSVAGFKPMLRRDGTQFKIQELFRKPAGEGRRRQVECPPGKVVVIEEGQPRCLVKERVEIPFNLDISAPKINYGFG